MDLESAARELYALLPGEFTTARNAKAKAAAQDGEKELAKQIKALPKPSAAAWLANMLAQHRRDEIDDVIRLGRAMSEAQEQLDPERLRELGAQRRELLTAVAAQGRVLAEELGHSVSAAAVSEVEQTLHAAMADPDAAAAVASGLLADSLSSNGIDPVELEGKVAVPGAAGTPPSTGPGPRQPSRPALHEPAGRRAKDDGQKARREAEAAERRRQRAQAEIDRAEQRLSTAEGKQQRILDRLDELADKREELQDQITELKRQITGLQREISGVDREEAAAEEDFAAAAQATARAKAAVKQARKDLDARP
jgi:hypothetical protein